MALNKLKFNSINVTPAANEAIRFNSSANGFDTATPGAMTLIATNTITSGVSSSDFTSSIDSTYDTYLFKFISLHPSSNAVEFKVNFRDGGSNFDATKTTTMFRSWQLENGTSTGLAYDDGRDLAQSTGVLQIGYDIGNDNDQSASGYLHLYDPSNTTFVKHFIARCNFTHYQDYQIDQYTAGYCNVTAAIDGVQFSMSSDNIDAGTFKLYGVV